MRIIRAFCKLGVGMTPMTVTLSAIYLNRMKEFFSIWISSFVFALCVALQVTDATCESTI